MTVALHRKGPATIYYGGANIGQTEGDITVKYAPEWKQFTPDQSTGPQGSFLINESVEIKIPLILRADAYELIRANAMPSGLKKVTPTPGAASSTVDGAHVAGDTVLTVADGTNFTTDDIIQIGTGQTREFRKITKSSNDFTVAALTYAHANGEDVINVLGTALSGAEAVGQTSLSVTDETDFVAGRVVAIGSGASLELRVVASTSSGVLVVTEAIGFAHASGELVMMLDADPKLRVGIGNNRSDIQFATLVIDPLDGSDDIKLWKALCTSEVELPIKKEEESIVELTFVGIEDTTRSNGDRLLSIGDLSVS